MQELVTAYFFGREMKKLIIPDNGQTEKIRI